MLTRWAIMDLASTTVLAYTSAGEGPTTPLFEASTLDSIFNRRHQATDMKELPVRLLPRATSPMGFYHALLLLRPQRAGQSRNNLNHTCK